MKNDKYKKARGGWSRILDITCEKCSKHVCYYQKDGPGPLKRMYVDRMIGTRTASDILSCIGCAYELGIITIYQKENRSAYRLFQSSVKKKVVKQSLAR